MNATRLLVSAISFALIGAAAQTAMADDGTYEYPQASISQASRAQVQADAAAAARAGQVERGEATFVMPAAKPTSTVTRAQVSAEAVASRKLGLIANGDAPAKELSAEELEIVRQAGFKALQTLVSVKGQ